ncbi:MAG: methyltransferase domain-containing protein [Nitrosotalea sp.]
MQNKETDFKQCCADFYQNELSQFLFGESMHPGGLGLTEEMAEKILVGKDCTVLDLACGVGTTAIFLAKKFGCDVVGLDLGRKNIESARRNSENAGTASKTDFQVGDTDEVKFCSETFDRIVCECAFCLFPDKTKASQEMYRVTKIGGKIGISDIVVRGSLPYDLKDALYQFTCILEAKSEQEYRKYLESAGFTNILFEDRKEDLLKLADDIKKRLFAAEVLIGLGKIKISLDLDKVKKTLQQIRACTETGLISYTMITATK